MADFQATVFDAPDERISRMTAVISGALAGRLQPRRILDIGCGTGRQILDLVRILPDAAMVGIDVSAHCIAAAKSIVGLPEYCEFHQADYMAFQGGTFDLVLTDSCLQWILADDCQLAEKLAADVAPGGLLVLSMPERGGFNRVLFTVRKVLAWLRSPLTDAAILGVARLLHPRHDPAMLSQRVDYMYWVPYRLWDQGFIQLLASQGLRVVSDTPMAHASLGQPRHRTVVLLRY